MSIGLLLIKACGERNFSKIFVLERAYALSARGWTRTTISKLTLSGVPWCSSQLSYPRSGSKQRPPPKVPSLLMRHRSSSQGGHPAAKIWLAVRRMPNLGQLKERPERPDRGVPNQTVSSLAWKLLWLHARPGQADASREDLAEPKRRS